MVKKIKVRYDKNLKKNHIEYHRLVDKSTYRYSVISELNKRYDLAFLIETQLGSVNKPDQLNYARVIEGLFAKYSLRYQIRPMEIAGTKNLFGMFAGGNKTVTHFAITFIVPSNSITREMFDDFLCEYDVQIGYKMIKSQDELFDDMLKGYLNNVFDPEYFEQSLYDSRVFDKFLATEDVSSLVQ